MSSDCQQKIHHKCDLNPLTGASAWTDINNHKNRYWHGNESFSQTGCTCSLDNSCTSMIPGNFQCHCDTYAVNAIDIGILTSTTKLPVTKLHYGGSINSWSKITYQVDALICSGKSSFYPSEKDSARYKKLKLKDTELEDKINELQTLLNVSLNETKAIKMEIDEKIYNLMNETQVMLDLSSSEFKEIKMKIDERMNDLKNETQLLINLSLNETQEIKMDIDGRMNDLKNETQMLLNQSLNETKEAQIEIDQSIENFKIKAQTNITTMQTEQGILLNKTVETLESTSAAMVGFFKPKPQIYTVPYNGVYFFKITIKGQYSNWSYIKMKVDLMIYFVNIT